MHTKSLLALAIACFLGLSAWTASGPASIAAELEPVEFDHLAPQQFALVAESRIDGEFTGSLDKF